MSDAERNRAVAEACELPIEKRGDIEFAYFDWRWRAIGFIGGYCPLRDANQAIEAANKVFLENHQIWRCGPVSSDPVTYACQWGVFLSSEETAPTFCGAIVAAILAAGGKR